MCMQVVMILINIIILQQYPMYLICRIYIYFKVIEYSWRFQIFKLLLVKWKMKKKINNKQSKW
jgi:hypothetical protein